MPPVGSSAQLVAQRHFDLELRPDGIVWLKRNAVPYDVVTDVTAAYDDFLRTVDDWLLTRRITSGQLGTKAKTPFGWLYDLRGAPGQRNDPAFEAIIKARRPDLLKRSPLLVVLVKTVAGRMQLNRLAGVDRDQVHVSDDFDDAVGWLAQEIAAARTARP